MDWIQIHYDEATCCCCRRRRRARIEANRNGISHFNQAQDSETDPPTDGPLSEKTISSAPPLPQAGPRLISARPRGRNRCAPSGRLQIVAVVIAAKLPFGLGHRRRHRTQTGADGILIVPYDSGAAEPSPNGAHQSWPSLGTMLVKLATRCQQQVAAGRPVER